MSFDLIDFYIKHSTGPDCRLKDVLRTHREELAEAIRERRAPMYKVLCKFAGEDNPPDIFCCDCDNLEAAKKVADRWKQGCFTYDADAIGESVVVAPCGEVVYEVSNKNK